MYTPEEIETIQSHIIEHLASGRSLKKILDDDDDMPVRSTIYLWLNPNKDEFDANFSNNYAQAREDSADVDADKIERVVDLIEDKTVDPAQGRAMMDGLKWIAARKKPKKYGDRLDLTTGGKELTQQVTIYELPNNNRDNNSTVVRSIIGVGEDGKPIYEDEKKDGEK